MNINGIGFELINKNIAMNLNNLTTKAQESVQHAQQLAFESDHQQIENEHLFQGILETDENVIPYLFSKLKVKSSLLKQLNESTLKSFSKVKGASQILSPKASQTVMNAVSIAKKQGDEFVAIEHLLIALFESKSTVSKVLQDQGITRSNLDETIKGLRKGEKITSASAEQNYNALQKFAKNYRKH